MKRKQISKEERPCTGTAAENGRTVYMADILIAAVVGIAMGAVIWKKIKDHRAGRGGCGCGCGSSCGGCDGYSCRSFEKPGQKQIKL
jgi:hypothetical protein